MNLRPPLPYGRQSISEEDIAAVVEVLRSDWLTQGPAVPAFEEAMAGQCHSRYAVAVSNATSALHLACLALDVGPGDWVWTSPNTFVASANCALYCGAQIDFVDIDPGTLNLCPVQLSAKLAQAQQAGRLPKVLIAVHFAGLSCDMQAIAALSRQYGFRIIEDASHAVGADYQSQPVGICQYSDITVLSFHPVKIITTGEGGMALCNDDRLAARMRLLRSHGITRDAGQFEQQADGPWHYEQQTLGFNYRMTDLQAALGLSQLARLDAFVRRRRELAGRYARQLAHLPLRLQASLPDCDSSFHLMVIRLDLARLTLSRAQVAEGLRQRGIATNVHYKAVHTQPFYQARGFRAGDFPEAERYARETLSLPMYPALTDEAQDRVVKALHEVLA